MKIKKVSDLLDDIAPLGSLCKDGKYCQILERILVVFLHSLNRPDCKAKFSLATNFAFPALRAWYMCKTLHKVISPYGPHDKICNSKWLKKLFFMEVWFFSDFIILWQQKNAANLLSHIVYLGIWLQRLKRQIFFLIILAIEPTWTWLLKLFVY